MSTARSSAVDRGTLEDVLQTGSVVSTGDLGFSDSATPPGPIAVNFDSIPYRPVDVDPATTAMMMLLSGVPSSVKAQLRYMLGGEIATSLQTRIFPRLEGKALQEAYDANDALRNQAETLHGIHNGQIGPLETFFRHSEELVEIPSRYDECALNIVIPGQVNDISIGSIYMRKVDVCLPRMHAKRVASRAHLEDGKVVVNRKKARKISSSRGHTARLGFVVQIDDYVIDENTGFLYDISEPRMIKRWRRDDTVALLGETVYKLDTRKTHIVPGRLRNDVPVIVDHGVGGAYSYQPSTEEGNYNNDGGLFGIGPKKYFMYQGLLPATANCIPRITKVRLEFIQGLGGPVEIKKARQIDGADDKLFGDLPVQYRERLGQLLDGFTTFNVGGGQLGTYTVGSNFLSGVNNLFGAPHFGRIHASAHGASYTGLATELPVAPNGVQKPVLKYVFNEPL